MAVKKYLSLDGLTEYDALIKAEVNTKINDLSAEVAYIDPEDNENIEDASTYLTTTDIVDNLESTSSDRPLSANQGKILNEKIEGLEASAITVSCDDAGNVSVMSNFGNKTVADDDNGNVTIS